MNNFLDLIGRFFSSILLKSIIAFAICYVFALIYMAIFGDDADMPAVLSISLLVGSIWVSHIIVDKIAKRKK